MRCTTTLALLALLLAPPAAGAAQACPDDRDGARLEAPRGAAAGRPVAIGVGIDAITYGSVPDCERGLAPREAEVELLVGPSREGPWTRLARTRARTVEWTPPRPGVVWLRVAGRGDGEPLEAVLPMIVASNAPPVLVHASNAELVADAERVRWAPEGDGSFALPAADAYWRLTRARSVSWLRVRADGSSAEVEANAALALELDDVLREGWRVVVAAEGAPTRERTCRGACRFDELPPGPVRIRVAPAAGGAEVELDGVAREGAPPRRLCAAHLLAGRVPPQGCGRFDSWPLSPQRPPGGSARCRAGAPIDAGAGVLWIGDVVCAGDGAFALPALAPATERTRPVAAFGRALVAEGRARGYEAIRIVIAGEGGVTAAALRALPERDGETCAPAQIAVTDDGAIVIGGRCERGGRAGGFVAFVEPSGREHVVRTSEPVTAMTADGDEVRVAHGSVVERCRARCRRLARLPEPSIAILAPEGGAWRVVGRSGTVRALHDRRVLATPPVEHAPSRVVASGGEVYALFGPVITGSEYHPYCVASAVARLEADRWAVLHATLGEQGRRLVCTYDGEHRLVIDIALAGGAVYARRRTPTREETDFAPLLPRSLSLRGPAR